MGGVTCPAGVTTWVIGRQYCPACGFVFKAVYAEGAIDLRCPYCEAVTMPAVGDEQRKVRGGS